MPLERYGMLSGPECAGISSGTRPASQSGQIPWVSMTVAEL
jgi:hypothetical protein